MPTINMRLHQSGFDEHEHGGCTQLACVESLELLTKWARRRTSAFWKHHHGSSNVFCAGGIVSSYFRPRQLRNCRGVYVPF